MQIDSRHWSFRLAEFAERRLGWPSVIIVVAVVVLLLPLTSG
jgi:hypothetical protein